MKDQPLSNTKALVCKSIQQPNRLHSALSIWQHNHPESHGSTHILAKQARIPF